MAPSTSAWDVPVLLRLPDLNAPVISPVAASAGGNPLVGKLMWTATGFLAVLAVWLVATGNPETSKSMPEAPSWNSPDRAATAADPEADSAAHHPVPNWKAPLEAGAANRGEASNSRGPWRAGAQVIQPGAATDIEPGAADRPAAPGSASWPGDAWPGRPPDTDPGHEAAIAAPKDAPGDAPPSGSAPPGAAGTSAPPSDPWPGSPQWPDDARNSSPADAANARTAKRPVLPNTNPTGSRPAARLDGGIQNMDVSPSYDGTR